MDQKNSDKLAALVNKRKENINAIRQFDDLFFEFARYRLKQIVQQINMEIEKATDDTLKIFYDDPYEFRKNPYYTLIQLFIGTSKFEFYLDNTRNNPALKFEGQEFNAKVKVSVKLQNEEKFKDLKEYPIQELTDSTTESILIDFIEKAYNR